MSRSFSVFFLTASLACAPSPATPVASPEPQPALAKDAPEPVVFAEPDVPEDEASVRPGVNDKYTKDKVDWFTKRFSRDGREVSDHKLDILSIMDLQQGQAVADIGAGTGLYTRELSAAVGETGVVYAVDVTEVFLERVRTIVAEEKLDNVTVVAADAKDVRLPAGSVDVALMSNVYHHVEYPLTYMATVHRAMKPDGRLFVADFRRHDGMDDEWVLEHVRAGEPTVTAELERAGFEVVKRHDIMERNYLLELRKRR